MRRERSVCLTKTSISVKMKRSVERCVSRLTLSSRLRRYALKSHLALSTSSWTRDNLKCSSSEVEASEARDSRIVYKETDARVGDSTSVTKV